MASEVLGQFGGDAVIPVAAALQHPNMEVRELAAGILGEIGDRRAVDPLIHVLKDDDWQVRFAVVNALGDIGDSRAAEPLTPLLDDPDTRVRALAERMLKRLKKT